MTKSDLQQLIAQNKLEAVVEALRQIGDQSEDKELKADIILLSGKFHRLKSETAGGLLTREEQELRFSHLQNNLLQIIGQLPAGAYPVSPHDLPLEVLLEKSHIHHTHSDQPAGTTTYLRLIILALLTGLGTFFWSFKQGIFHSGSGDLARFIVLAILGLCTAFALFGVMRSSMIYRGSCFNGTLEFGGPVVVFLSVILLGYHLTTDKRAFDVTLEVLAPEGHLQYLGNHGVVTLHLPAGPVDKTIDKDGRVTFPGLASEVENQGVKIRFRLNNQPYRAKYPDSIYQLTRRNRVVQLAVVLDHLDKIEGFVENFDPPNLRLPGVTVRVRQASVQTDSNGLFVLQIPPSMQAKYQTLEAWKTGYEIWRQDSIPVHSLQELPIRLKPLQKHRVE